MQTSSLVFPNVYIFRCDLFSFRRARCHNFLLNVVFFKTNKSAVMVISRLLQLGLIALAKCTDSSSSNSNSQIILSGSVTGSITGSSEATLPTGSYLSYSSTITDSTTSIILGSVTNAASVMGTGNQSSSTSFASSSSQIFLKGSVTTAINGTGSANSTATSTSSSVQPTNTTPCNNYPEFCSRKYSNITEVSSHNSPL